MHSQKSVSLLLTKLFKKYFSQVSHATVKADTAANAARQKLREWGCCEYNKRHTHVLTADAAFVGSTKCSIAHSAVETLSQDASGAAVVLLEPIARRR